MGALAERLGARWTADSASVLFAQLADDVPEYAGLSLVTLPVDGVAVHAVADEGEDSGAADVAEDTETESAEDNAATGNDES